MSTLLGHATYLPVLQEIGITESDYLGYAHQLHKIFPEQWLKEQFEKRIDREGILTSLHPIMGFGLPDHPVPHLLLSQSISPPQLSELIRLGRNLKDTSELRGIDKVTNRLRIFREFLGAQFEIQVLAEFVRAKLSPSIIPLSKGGPDFVFVLDGEEVYGEMIHLNASDCMNTMQRLGSRIDTYIMGRNRNIPGRFHVDLNSSCIQDGEFMKEFDQVSRQVRDKPIHHIGSNYSITFDPNSSPKGYEINSPELPYTERLRARTRSQLKKKGEKFPKNGSGLVAIDVRDVTIPYVSFKAEERRKDAAQWLRSIIKECNNFLRNTSRVQTVFVWHHKDLSKESASSHTVPDQVILVGGNVPVQKAFKKSLSSIVLPSEIPWLNY